MQELDTIDPETGMSLADSEASHPCGVPHRRSFTPPRALFEADFTEEPANHEKARLSADGSQEALNKASEFKATVHHTAYNTWQDFWPLESPLV